MLIVECPGVIHRSLACTIPFSLGLSFCQISGQVRFVSSSPTTFFHGFLLLSLKCAILYVPFSLAVWFRRKASEIFNFIAHEIAHDFLGGKWYHQKGMPTQEVKLSPNCEYACCYFRGRTNKNVFPFLRNYSPVFFVVCAKRILNRAFWWPVISERVFWCSVMSTTTYPKRRGDKWTWKPWSTGKPVLLICRHFWSCVLRSCLVVYRSVPYRTVPYSTYLPYFKLYVHFFPKS